MINYEQDFYGWTQEQAAFLKAGRLNELDIENLIEEVESMGRSEKRELQSRLTVLLAHLLKWKYQPSRRGTSWDLTIQGQRIDFLETLSENPGIKPHLDDILKSAYTRAVVQAAKESRLSKNSFPEVCPWTLSEVTQTGFYPE